MDYTKLLSIPPVIGGFISVISCIYVCISAIRGGYIPCKPVRDKIPRTMSWKMLQQKLKKYNQTNVPHEFITELQTNPPPRYTDTNHPTMMVDILFWMCVCDGLHAAEIILNWFPLAFGSPTLNKWQCEALGIFAQFLAIQSPCWHLLLAWNLGYLLLGGSIHKFSGQKKFQFIMVNLIPFICTILPVFYGAYGRYENNKKYNDYECWLVPPKWQYMYVAAIVLSLICHYAVIIIAISKWKHFSQSGFDQHFKFVVIKLLRFIVIYTIVRFFPIMDRIWEFSANAPPPFLLILAHHVGISLLGFSNAVVWRINQKQIPYTKSYTDLKDAHHKKKKYQRDKDRDREKRAMMMSPHADSGLINDYHTYKHHNSFDTVETTATDYMISSKITPRVAPNQMARNPRRDKEYQQKLLSNNASRRQSTTTGHPDFDLSTPEYDPESAVLWTLDNNEDGIQ